MESIESDPIDFVTQAASLSGAFDGIQSRVGNAVAAAIVGGTASVLGGGKFENGAATGAFSIIDGVRLD